MRARKIISSMTLIIILSLILLDLWAIPANASQNLNVQYQQSDARSMIDMVNNLRAENGVGGLQYSYDLEEIAKQRAAELVSNYSHTRPNGGAFNSYTYNGVISAAENISKGRIPTAYDAYYLFEEKYESYEYQAHRRLMLDSNFLTIGIAHVVYNGTDYWVQEFSTRNVVGAYTNPSNGTETRNVGGASEPAPSKTPTTTTTTNNQTQPTVQIPKPPAIKAIDYTTITVKNNKVLYDGTEKYPAIEVDFYGIKLNSNHYSVTYTNNIEIGTGTITVTGKYPYTGSKTATFEIYCDHHYTEMREAVEATCTNEGYTGDIYCTICGNLVKKGQVIQQHAHVYPSEFTQNEEKHSKKCQNCSNVIEEQHKFGKEYQKDSDYHFRKCETCGYIQKEHHKGGTATCKDLAVCEVCKVKYGKVNTENHIEIKTINEKTATCTEEGYTGDKYCTKCCVIVEIGKVIPATGHVGGTATCKDKAICDVCHTEYGELNPENHINTKVVTTPATCTKIGMKESVYCNDCGKTIKVGSLIPETGHKGGFATCDKRAVCEVCHIEYGSLNPNVHTNTEMKNALPVSEEHNGYTGDIYCSKCQKLLRMGEIIEAPVQNVDVITTEASATTDPKLVKVTETKVKEPIIEEKVEEEKEEENKEVKEDTFVNKSDKDTPQKTEAKNVATTVVVAGTGVATVTGIAAVSIVKMKTIGTAAKASKIVKFRKPKRTPKH